jgi:hypothetical protein
MFDWYDKSMRKIAYGGPAFDISGYVDDFRSRNYIPTKKLYEDAELAVDYMEGVSPNDLVWFEDSLSPSAYAHSGTTVEGMWKEDYGSGVRYMEDLIGWFRDNGEEIPEEGFPGIDPSDSKCIKRLMWDYDWDTVGTDYDMYWGPNQWVPGVYGEWERCRRIAYDGQDYPVTVLFDGRMVDGAHRLAVANHKRMSSYPCLVGVPIRSMEDLVSKSGGKR